MSKKHRRLESFREVTKRRREKPTPPEPWTWKDRIGIWAAILLVLTMISASFLIPYSRFRRSINSRLRDWKSKYHMSEQQFDSVRRIEKDFHSYGKVLSGAPAPTPEEVIKHHEEIAEQLSPQDAKEFLQAETSLQNH